MPYFGWITDASRVRAAEYGVSQVTVANNRTGRLQEVCMFFGSTTARGIRGTGGLVSNRHGRGRLPHFHEQRAGGLTWIGIRMYGITVLCRPFFTTAATSSCVFREGVQRRRDPGPSPTSE